MSEKPEFFWSPPDGAPIIGMTPYRGMIVVATATGVYVVRDEDSRGLDSFMVERIKIEKLAL